MISSYKFDEIAYNITAKRTPCESDMEHYIGLEHLETGNLYVSNYGSKVPIKGDKLIMKTGDILLGKRNAYLRRAAIAPHDGLFSAHGMILRPKIDVIDEDFFPFFIASDYFFDEIIRISVGGLSPTINWKDLKELQFNLPSLEEQKALANKLWAAYSLKESYKRLIKATDEMVKSQFIEMFGDTYMIAETTLSDFINLKAGKSKKSELIQENKDICQYPCYGGNGIRGYVDDYTHNGTFCIIGRQGAQCGNVQIAQGKFYATEHAVVATPLTDINCIWLFYALTQMNLNQYARGVAQPGLAVNQLEKLSFSLPSNEKQNRFGSIAEQADKSKFTSLKSQFIEMFGNYEMNANFGDLFSSARNGANIKQGTISGGIPITRIETISEGEINRDKMGYAGIVDNTYSSYYLQDGDILVSHINSMKHIGKCALYQRINDETIIHGMNLLCLRPYKDIVNPQYVTYLLRSSIMRKLILDITKPAVNQASFTVKDLCKLKVMLPPISEQEEFVAIVDQADKSKYIN